MSVNESFFNLVAPVSTEQDAPSEITFITVVLAIVIAWILVALWTRVIENLAFGTLGLNGDSFWHAFIVAIVFSVIFIIFVWMIDRYRLVPGTLSAEVEGFDSPVTRADEVDNLPGPSEQSRNGNFVPPNMEDFSSN